MTHRHESRLAAPDSEALWGTFGCERTVLFVARTLTSTARLLEAMDLFRNDFRIRARFTISNGTRFAGGVEQLLHDSGVHDLVPWPKVEELDYDLALSASENVDVDVLTKPVLVLPHGLGFNKYVPDSADGGLRLAGLPPARALRTGRVKLFLSHPEQIAQLGAAAAETRGNTIVVGDPTCDRMLASVPLRARYRALLGTAGRRLVLVASTWSESSLIGSWRTLPHRLLAELPADEYQVALVLHPNVWARYGPADLRVMLADALDAGLRLIPPHRGWHALLVAADQIITDHGSMGLHAAALDKPLLLSSAEPDTVAGSPVAELARIGDRLEPAEGLREQLSRNVAAHAPGRFEAVTSRVFAYRGEATERLRNEVYRHLPLNPPVTEPPLLRAPDPESEYRNVTAFRVSSRRTGDIVVLSRYPAAARPESDNRHLVVEEGEANLRLPERAAVLVRARYTGHEDAWNWTESALNAYPFARLAAAATAAGCVVRTRHGQRATISSSGDAAALGSLAYVLLTSRQFADTTMRLRIGKVVYTASVMVIR
ncbi:hypothetical protein [Amycolatopsis sp. NPDC059021]|uniref:hypothetical protein n=1 Tax=Amycolatopsis sp. NPDC059021 TaxID=3346704 RepID=UPI00366ADFCD